MQICESLLGIGFAMLEIGFAESDPGFPTLGRGFPTLEIGFAALGREPEKGSVWCIPRPEEDPIPRVCAPAQCLAQGGEGGRSGMSSSLRT